MSRLLFYLLFVLSLASCDIFENEQPAIPGKIVFSMPDNSDEAYHQIFVMNTNGNELKQLTFFDQNSAFQPSWSPDASRIVFTTTLKSFVGGTSIYIMDADGSNIQPMKLSSEAIFALSGSHPTWSPDGNKIAFHSCACEIGTRISDIFVYDLETDSVSQITDHPSWNAFPSWSPDGNQIAFTSNRDYLNEGENRLTQDLYVVSIGTSKITKVTDNGNISGWAWIPYSSKVLIGSNLKPFKWYSVDVSSSAIDSNFHLNEDPEISRYRPIKWSHQGRILMTLSVTSELTLYFYNKEEDILTKGTIMENTLGFDWYFNDSFN